MQKEKLIKLIETEKKRLKNEISAFEELEKCTARIIKKYKLSLYKRKSSHKNYLLNKKVEEICGLYSSSVSIIKDLEKMELSGYDDLPFKFTNEAGYIVLCDKKLLPKRVEHRYIMDKKIGRKLERCELIHHIDENKKNNSIENLMIVSSKEHGRIHAELNKRN